MKQRPSEQLWKDFGAWIRQAREDLRLTQEEAAKRADIDRQQWYRIETGKSGTRRDTVIEIARAVGVDVTEALTRAGYSPSDAAAAAGLFSGFNKIPADRRDLAIRQIQGIIDSLAEEENPDTDYIDD